MGLGLYAEDVLAPSSSCPHAALSLPPLGREVACKVGEFGELVYPLSELRSEIEMQMEMGISEAEFEMRASSRASSHDGGDIQRGASAGWGDIQRGMPRER